MYYKKPTYNNVEVQKKIDSFNKELQTQYRQHISPPESVTVEDEDLNVKKAVTPKTKETQIGVSNLLTSDNIIIIGLIVLLLLEESKDYALILILASIILLNL